jgi:NNP family nitrate/nitrite transporter-like MFS transporter
VAPAIPKAIAGHVPLASIGRANGLALVGYTLGTALTVLFGRTVLAPMVGGWRAAMVLAALLMVAVALAWLGLVRDRAAMSRHASLGDVLGLLRHRALVRVAVMHFLLFGGYLALLGMLPRALGETGLAPAEVGLAVAGWLFAAGIANFVGPVVSDRLGRRRPLVVVGSIVAGTALALLAVAPRELVLPLLVVAALGGGTFAPLLLAMPLEIPGIGPARAGAALGLLMLVGQLGGFVLPVLSGLVKDGPLGFAGALGLLALAHAAILLPALRMPETGRAGENPALRAQPAVA